MRKPGTLGSKKFGTNSLAELDYFKTRSSSSSWCCCRAEPGGGGGGWLSTAGLPWGGVGYST